MRNPKNTADEPPQDKPRVDECVKQNYAAVGLLLLFLEAKWKQLTG